MSICKVCVSTIFALGLLASPALAQQAAQTGRQGAQIEARGGGMMAAGAMMGAGKCRMMMGDAMAGGVGMMAMMDTHVEGRLAFLKAELKITEAQEPLWNKFAAVLRDNSAARTKAVGAGMMAAEQAANLPDRIAMREKRLSAELAAIQNLKAAVDPLYAALGDAQKKTADELSGPMGMTR